MYISTLFKRPDSRLYAAKVEVIPRSREELQTIALINAVVNGYHAKPSEKKKHFVKVEKPKKKQKKTNVVHTREEKRKMFDRVKIEGQPNLDPTTGRDIED